MIDFGWLITFAGGVRVEPGDVVVGDINGVVIIPRARAVAIVASVVTVEERVLGRIGASQSTQSIFDETGVI